MKYIVYLTTNIKNQHIYVGVHQTENPDIFDGYIGNGINRFIQPSKSSARKVGQYTMDGKLVKIFNTVREARKEFSNVGNVLKGRAKHCHNFIFKYIE